MKNVVPEVKLFGVEAADAAGMTASYMAGEVVTLPTVGLFADGASVRRVGDNTFDLIYELADGMITCDTDEICAAIKTAFNDTRCILEPAGALGVAGLVQYIQDNGIKGKTFVAIASGANMDFDRLRFVSERADSSENLMAVTIPEKPGEFMRFYNKIFPRNVTEFSYRFDPLNVGKANIMFAFQAKSPQDRTDVLKALSETEDYRVADLSGNDVAKTHIRHLAGGRSLRKTEERVFAFEFPEKPGALKEFLEKIHDAKGNINVSLFHYRNHGADVGRVLVGLQNDSTNGSNGSLDEFLDSLGFHYEEETNNRAYESFLLKEPSPLA